MTRAISLIALPETWNYNRTDTIQVRSPSGRFTFRFIHVDSLGEPVAELSPVATAGGNPHPASLAGEQEDACSEFATARVQIRDEPEIVAAGRAGECNKGRRLSIRDCVRGERQVVCRRDAWW